MGHLLPCPLSSHKNKDSKYQAYFNHIQSDASEEASLSSQQSLPFIPSLSSSFKQHELQSPATHCQCLATLKVKGHSSYYISSLTIAGKFLYSGSSSSEIRAWSLLDLDNAKAASSSTDNNIVATGNGAAIKCLVVLGDKLFSAYQDHKIRMWKIDNNNNSTTTTSGKKYECIATLPTLNDRLIRCFSASNYVEVRRHKKRTWVHHVDTVSALSLSTDNGSLLYSASWDRTFKVWRTSDFICLESVKNAHDDAINAIVVSNDGYVYTGSADKKIKVWKKSSHAASGEAKHSLVATLEKHKSAVNALALSTDGWSVLYSGASDRSILVWERDHGNDIDGDVSGHMELRGALRGHTKAILCLAVVSNTVFSGSADNTIRIWRRWSSSGNNDQMMSYSCFAVLEGHRRPVKCLTAAVDCDNSSRNNSVSGTSFLAYSGSLDCNIKIWQIWVPFL